MLHARLHDARAQHLADAESEALEVAQKMKSDIDEEISHFIFYTKTDANAAKSLVEHGLNPAFFFPDNRYGGGLYVVEDPSVGTVEVAYHAGIERAVTLRTLLINTTIPVEKEAEYFLDLTAEGEKRQSERRNEDVVACKKASKLCGKGQDRADQDQCIAEAARSCHDEDPLCYDETVKGCYGSTRRYLSEALRQGKF